MNLAEFGSWGLAQGSVANPEPNYKYNGQCVSLIQQYLYQVFKMPFKARGNAKDWVNNVPNGFTKLNSTTKLQSGDIIVYGSNYGGGYGHIGLIDSNGKFYDQNGVKKLAIGYRDKPFNGYICVLRPDDQSKLKLNINRTEEFWCRVDKKEAAVRSQANSKSSQVGSRVLYRGDTFKCIGSVKGENVGGNDIWYKSWKGNYVWSGGITKI